MFTTVNTIYDSLHIKWIGGELIYLRNASLTKLIRYKSSVEDEYHTKVRLKQTQGVRVMPELVKTSSQYIYAIMSVCNNVSMCTSQYWL